MGTGQEHTVKAFDQDIKQLRALISQMGGLAEQAIHDAMKALQRGDTALADEVRKKDKAIDAIEAEVEKLVVRVIALRAPMADDLREVIAALKIAAVLERIGDYSKNIAKRVPRSTPRAKSGSRRCHCCRRWRGWRATWSMTCSTPSPHATPRSPRRSACATARWTISTTRSSARW
jgi:transposase